MHAQVFIKRVEEFVQRYCQPHMRQCKIDWELDRPRAVVRCEDFQKIHWDIPVEVVADNPEKMIIPVSRDESVEVSEKGFFTFLWRNSRFLNSDLRQD